MPRSGRIGGLVVSALLLARPLLAQSFPALDLHAQRPPIGHEAGLRSESPQAEGAGQMHLSLGVSYAHDALLWRAALGNDVPWVERQLLLHALVARGFGSWLTLALDLPFAALQEGEPFAGPGGQPTRARAPAFGDLGVRAKASLLGATRPGGFQLGVSAGASAPTGHTGSALSEGAVMAHAGPLAELDLLVVRLRASVEARLRTEERTVVGERFGHGARWLAGAVVRPQLFGLDSAGKWQIHVEAWGITHFSPRVFAESTSPIALALSTRVHLGAISPLLGFELPLNEAIGNPGWRISAGISWAPRRYDSDEDGIGDERDECPEIAEDHDGFEDRDGCSDPDNDDDGVMDADDRCPHEREDEDGYQDEDGCADSDNDRDGTLDSLDACPDRAGPTAARNTDPGCPVGDRDGDEVADDVDDCPRRKEDRDGFRDDDGCPDPDNDGDGLLDRRDRCPNDAGPRTRVGCPEPPRATP